MIFRAFLFVVLLAAGFGLGLLATAWVESDWPTPDPYDNEPTGV